MGHLDRFCSLMFLIWEFSLRNAAASINLPAAVMCFVCLYACMSREKA